MAPWGDTKLFFCILFITYCCAVTLAQIPMDCCLKVSNKKIERPAVADYRRQIRGQGCHLDAVIFLTRRGRTLCVSADNQWIEGLMHHVDRLKKICKKNKQDKRCFGVNP